MPLDRPRSFSSIRVECVSRSSSIMAVMSLTAVWNSWAALSGSGVFTGPVAFEPVNHTEMAGKGCTDAQISTSVYMKAYDSASFLHHHSSAWSCYLWIHAKAYLLAVSFELLRWWNKITAHICNQTSSMTQADNSWPFSVLKEKVISSIYVYFIKVPLSSNTN